MAARYLLRFDDICPSMNWGVWDRVELMLRQAGVRPLLAVVPDNRDPALGANPPNPEFWSRVRAWRDLGWTIGMHGYRHEYVSHDRGILGLNPFSEFAGLAYGEQLAKLESSTGIFESEGIKPSVWVAPAHSFDADTVKALRRVGINSISDGYALWPYADAEGIFWLPQQLWRFRALPLGVWTVCFHINKWGDTDVGGFEKNLGSYRAYIVEFGDIRAHYGRRTSNLLDRTFARIYKRLLKIRRYMRLPRAVDSQAKT